MSRHFTEDLQAINRYMKKCSTSVVIREMQVKTTVRFHLTPIKMVINKNTSNNRCWWGSGGKGTLLHYWWECKLVQPLWKAVWRFLRKLGRELPFDPVIPLLSLYPKDLKLANYSDAATSMYIAAHFTMARLWNQPRCPSTDEWIKKLCYIYKMEHYSAIKNNIMTFADKWMELENITLSWISQSHKNQRQNVFPDQWMMIYNGWRAGVKEEWRNFGLCREKWGKEQGKER